MYSNQDIFFTIKNKDKKKYTAKVVFNNPIVAPIDLNTAYGKVIITDTVKGKIEYPLYSKEIINKAGFLKKITTALSYIIFRLC